MSQNESSVSKSTRQALLRTLVHIEHMHKIIVDKRLSPLHLHRGQHSILQQIEIAESDPHRRALSQKDIAKTFGISAATVAMTVKKLEENGCISRTTAPIDNRYNEVRLTETGHELLDQSRAVLHSLNDEILEGITEEELSCMADCLLKMQENMCRMPESNESPDLSLLRDKES